MTAAPQEFNEPTGLPGKWDLAQRVTSRIIAQLESVQPGDWRCPWSRAGQGKLPVNGFTGKAYQGTNTLLLWIEAMEHGYQSHRWLTFKQMRLLGGRLNQETLARAKGSKDCLCVRYGTYDKKVPTWIDKDGHARTTDEVPYAKPFYVFNTDQILDLPARLYEEDRRTQPYGESTRQTIRDFVIKAGVGLNHGGDRAFYRPGTDQVTMPYLSCFIEASGVEGPEHYDSTLLHEIVHWSGHPGRLARPDLAVNDKASYAREELVAEFGSAILCAYFGVTGRLQHPEYIASWLQALRKDTRALFVATRMARQAYEFLLERGSLPPADEAPTPECVAADQPSMEKREVMKFENQEKKSWA
jgi:antirestriction protein ArdC